MYLLTIVFGPSPTPWALLFKDEESAQKAYDSTLMPLEVIQVTDDFGQHCSLLAKSVHGIMLENLELSKMAQIERGLHMARIQARAQSMAQNDPILKNIRTTQGPAMIDPMGMSNGSYR